MKRFTLLYLLVVLFATQQAFSQNAANGLEVKENSISFSLHQVDYTVEPYSNYSIRIKANNTLPQIETHALSTTPVVDNVIVAGEGNKRYLIGQDWRLEVEAKPFSIKLFDLSEKYKAKAILSDIRFEGDSLTYEFKLDNNEMILGGGERAIEMNRRGYNLKLRNEPHYSYGWGEQNLNFSQPYFISSNGYSLFYNSAGVGYADIDKNKKGYLSIGSKHSGNELYLTVGENVEKVHAHFAQIVGTQPLPPRWAMGNIMSRFGYTSEKDASTMLEKMLSNDIPVDALVLDLYWFGNGEGDFRMGDLDWNRDSFPNPERMIKNFRKKGVETILITEPFVLQESKNWKNGDQNEIFGQTKEGESFVIDEFWFGEASLIDVFSKKGQDWFWSFYQKRMHEGVSGWWGDLGEPEMHPDGIHYSLGETNEVHNVYGQYWSKLVNDGFDKNFPNKRLFHLNRAGFVGVQKFSSFPWSGDVDRTWHGFKPQISIMLGLSMGQVPYASSDLGGFCRADERQDETYTRWMQFGTFNPIYRPHSAGLPSEVVEYPDSIQTIVKRYMNLRYELLPYNYNLAFHQALHGTALVKPSFYNNDQPKISWDVLDNYAWGDAFFVSAIQEPGVTEKEILLPNGVWYNWFTNEKHLGNGWIMEKVTLENIPVYAKAGSFVPMTSRMKNTKEYDTAELTMHYFDDLLASKNEYVWYNDNGIDKNSIEKKHYETAQFQTKRTPNRLTIDVQHRGKFYSSSTGKRTLNFSIHGVSDVKEVRIDSQIVNDIVYDNMGNLTFPCTQKESNHIEIIF